MRMVMASDGCTMSEGPASRAITATGRAFVFGALMRMAVNSFDTRVATEFGVNAAVLLRNIGFWVEKNASNGRNLHDGRYWTYNSQSAFERQFPYMSRQNIRTALDRLERGGMIESGCFNKRPYDRTKWYTLTRDGAAACGLSSLLPAIVQNQPMDCEKSTDTSSKINQPIPDRSTDRSTDKRHIHRRDPEREEAVGRVISHLNEVAHKSYRASSRKSAQTVGARLSEGYTEDQLVHVIDVKCEEWLGTDMEKYLRPETLFAPSHIEGYVNQPARADAMRRGRDVPRGQYGVRDPGGHWAMPGE